MTQMIKDINGVDIYANRAVNDKDGNQIDTTYAKESELSEYAKTEDIPSIDGLMAEDKLGYDEEGKIKSYDGTEFAGSGGGMSNNETVLWEGEASSSVTLSETASNFEKIAVVTQTGQHFMFEWYKQNLAIMYIPAFNTDYSFYVFVYFKINETSLTTTLAQVINFGLYAASSVSPFWDKSASWKNWCTKVIGINRKST